MVKVANLTGSLRCATMRVGRPVILSRPIITRAAFGGVGGGPVGMGEGPAGPGAGGSMPGASVALSDGLAVPVTDVLEGPDFGFPWLSGVDGALFDCAHARAPAQNAATEIKTARLAFTDRALWAMAQGPSPS